MATLILDHGAAWEVIRDLRYEILAWFCLVDLVWNFCFTGVGMHENELHSGLPWKLELRDTESSVSSRPILGFSMIFSVAFDWMLFGSNLLCSVLIFRRLIL